MRYRQLGQTESQLSVVGQGTWNLEHADRAGACRALRQGVSAGMSHIDTAEMYGNGRVERLVGEAIEGLRDDVFLATKVVPTNASYEGTIRACESSLRRLRTEHLDLYMLHWPSHHPVSETLRAFVDLQQQGKLRWLGVSNFDVDELSEVVSVAPVGVDRL